MQKKFFFKERIQDTLVTPAALSSTSESKILEIMWKSYGRVTVSPASSLMTKSCVP